VAGFNQLHVFFFLYCIVQYQISHTFKLYWLSSFASIKCFIFHH
jgi:hypothetical protein